MKLIHFPFFCISLPYHSPSSGSIQKDISIFFLCCSFYHSSRRYALRISIGELIDGINNKDIKGEWIGRGAKAKSMTNYIFSSEFLLLASHHPYRRHPRCRPHHLPHSHQSPHSHCPLWTLDSNRTRLDSTIQLKPYLAAAADVGGWICDAEDEKKIHVKQTKRK